MNAADGEPRAANRPHPADAQDAPFFVTKLNVKVLPCLVFFCDGKAYDRIVGAHAGAACAGACSSSAPPTGGP